MSAPVDVLAVMDAYSVPGQICCGMPVGGGYDENGNGEPPSCCGQPFTEADMQEARAAVAELIEAAKKAQVMMAMPERIEPRHRQELCAAISRCEIVADPRLARVGGAT